MNNRIRKVKTTLIYNESKIENIFNLYLFKSPEFSKKKELDFKSCQKVLRELSILFCLDLESCFKLIQKNYYKKKSVSFIDFKECLLDFVNQKESDLNFEFIKEQKNPFDFDYDFLPTNDDMVNNKENILNCIHSTNDINLILIHRSLYIIQKKFEQNKSQIKSIYEKYGEYFEQEENLLIDQSYLPRIMEEIFKLNKFEISDVASFKEALYKEMEYCKDINIEQYIFNDFVDFIKNNRLKYNFIFREKRNNSNFNLDDYIDLNFDIIDEWSKEANINIIDDEYDKKEIDLILQNINNRKILSSKYNYRKLELNISKDDLKINLDLINDKEGLNNDEYKDNEYSYSESSPLVSGRRESSNRGKTHGLNYGNESLKGSEISKINTKRKDDKSGKNSVIPENIDDEEEKEKESNNNNESEKKENENKEEEEENEENEEEEDSKINKSKEKSNLDDIDLVNVEEEKKEEKEKNLLFRNPKKKILANLNKKFYETIYNKKVKNINSIKYIKYYIYADIIPLIIADFISDQKNLYVVIDRSDDLRDNLSTIFDSEILYKLGESNFEEVINQMLMKITEYKNLKNKIEKNIENYEKLSLKMKKENQDITYINITLQKLKDFSNWLNTKLFHMQNDIKIFKDFEKNKKEEEERIYGPRNKFAKERLKEKKDKIVEDYKQLKKDLEIRKFMLQKKKRMSNIYRGNKIKLKPIINSTILNNTNNISNIEKDNSINSNEMSGDDYKNIIELSEQNASDKKNPKVKNFNFKSNFENILTEKKVESDEEEGNQDENIIENINNNVSNDVKDFSDKDINNEELIESNKDLFQSESKEKYESKNIEKELDHNKKENVDKKKGNNLKENKKEEKSKQIINNKNNQMQNENQQIKQTKKVKLILKSKLNSNTKESVKSNNNNNALEKTVKLNTNDINNIKSNIISSDKLRFNPKTTRNTKNRINLIPKNIIKQEKPKSKEEIRESAIIEIFNFYSSKNIDNLASFETMNINRGHMNLKGFCKFCNDFKIPLTKDKILALFNKSISNDSRIMSLQEFKICLISMSFEINKAQIDDINRSINIFIGKVNQKNKEKSRFEKENKQEKEKNKKIINNKLKLIETYQNKSEEELIEELFKLMEIDESKGYKQKMKGIYGIENKSINLPKIQTQEVNIINNTKSEHSKSNALLTFSKKDKGNPDKIRKMNIGMRVWVKGMVEKERSETPKNKKIEYDFKESEESENKEEKDYENKEDEKKEDLPVIENKGIPLFSRNKKKDEKKYLYEKFL